ncbi:MAG TPA: hypothetical protein PKB13_09520 [Clostridia bacterium]|nr:hypothetical protein [Clostridia bacterium]
MEYGMAREMKTFACAMCDDIKLNLLESDYLLDSRPCAFDRLTPRTDILKVLRGDPAQLDMFGGATYEQADGSDHRNPRRRLD